MELLASKRHLRKQEMDKYYDCRVFSFRLSWEMHWRNADSNTIKKMTHLNSTFPTMNFNLPIFQPASTKGCFVDTPDWTRNTMSKYRQYSFSGILFSMHDFNFVQETRCGFFLHFTQLLEIQKLISLQTITKLLKQNDSCNFLCVR